MQKLSELIEIMVAVQGFEARTLICQELLPLPGPASVDRMKDEQKVPNYCYGVGD
jgi:hypothetical protein